MAKTKVCYCFDCHRQTRHTRVERDSIGTGLGPIRALLAVTTLGVSEVTLEAKYECSRCGRITNG